MQRISTGFTQAIGAIKQWLTKFGLRDKDGNCVVPLDMVVKMEPAAPSQRPNSSALGSGEEAPAEGEEPPAPKDPWTDKQIIIDTVLSKVDRIMAFRQSEYNDMREQVRKELEEQERLKAEEEQRAEEEAKR